MEDNITPIKPRLDEREAADKQQVSDAAEHFAEECKAIGKILGDTEAAMDFVLAFHEMMDFERVAEIRQLKYRVFRTADGDWKYEGREATPIVRAVD